MFEINNERWFIKFTSPYNKIFLMPNGEYTKGVCDDNTKTIYLAETLEGKLLKKVLCHEIVHASMFSYNVFLGYEEEELLANIIATYGAEIIDHANDMFKRLQLCKECHML